MNLALRWSYFVRTFSVGLKIFCSGPPPPPPRQIRTCNTCCLRDIKAMQTAIIVFYKSKQLQMLTAGPNYIMIRRAIFGKVHGHGVKEFWLISQFPAKHTGVASGARIVFARPGLARLLRFGHGGYKQFIIYIACSPQSDCISLFRDPSVTFWPSRIRIYVRDVILVVRSVYKQSREKHRHFSFSLQSRVKRLIAAGRLNLIELPCPSKNTFVSQRIIPYHIFWTFIQ